MSWNPGPCESSSSLPSPASVALVRSYFLRQQTKFFAIIIEKRLNPAWSSPQLYTLKHYHQIIPMFHQEIFKKTNKQKKQKPWDHQGSPRSYFIYLFFEFLFILLSAALGLHCCVWAFSRQCMGVSLR